MDKGELKRRTIRELGGEFFAELNIRQRDANEPLSAVDWRLTQDIVDLVMGILARHSGSLIVNDEDIPVVALPTKKSD